MPDEEICGDLDNIEVIPCKNELQLLLRWTEIIREVDPEYITGYNIFGFDFAYMTIVLTSMINPIDINL